MDTIFVQTSGFTETLPSPTVFLVLPVLVFENVQ